MDLDDLIKEHQEGVPRVSGLIALWRTLQRMDSVAWRAVRDDPALQFARWLAAIAAIVVYGFLPHAISNAPGYVPALVAAVLLLPDAKSITVGGLKFDRLQKDVIRQNEEIAKLNQQINNSQKVIIALGPAVADAIITGKIMQGEQALHESAEAIEKFLESLKPLRSPYRAAVAGRILKS
jgi:hypothetical protein